MFRKEWYTALLVVFDDKGRRFVSGACQLMFQDDQIVIDLSKDEDDWYDSDNKTLTFRLKYKNGKFNNPKNPAQMFVKIDSDFWDEDIPVGGLEGYTLFGLWDGEPILIEIEELKGAQHA